jgi:Tfp pilus assembly protein PilF
MRAMTPPLDALSMYAARLCRLLKFSRTMQQLENASKLPLYAGHCPYALSSRILCVRRYSERLRNVQAGMQYSYRTI